MPRVLNIRHGGVPEGAVYVGRAMRNHSNPDVRKGSKFGNPFPASREGRGSAIQLFEEWFFKQPQLMADAVAELKGKDLVCWCAPDNCHAEVLMGFVNNEDG